MLQTKLYIPPSRPERVSRPRLIERLNAGLHRKLTLISAPAGFGKTTLVSAWIAGCGRPAAWLALDAEDSAVPRFLAYLVAALQTVSPGVGASALSALQSPQPPPTEALLASLLNELTAATDPFVLVLDDYHVLDAAPVDAALAFLLEHMPPQMHLVIASREDPPLPLARLRARGQLTELRVSDLRFTPAEAADFLNRTMGLALSQAEVAALEARTEGWIAGLHLAALALQSIRAAQGPPGATHFIQAFTGSHRFVLDYLVEEVLQHQPAKIRRFLLQTALLDRLCGPLCDAVRSVGTDDRSPEDSQSILETLERDNVFVVPLDGQRRWYRYHHLFADVLRAHLMAEQPQQVPGLHRRASVWYEQNGWPPDAIRHALAAGDFERAAALIERAHPAMDISYQSATWLGWAKALPEAVVRARPVLSVGYAWALLDHGELEASETRLRDAERWLDGMVQLPQDSAGSSTEARPGQSQDMVVVDEAQFRSLPASIATARAYRALALGDVPSAVEHAQRAFELTPEEDLIRHTQATSLLAIARYANGDLEAAERSLASFQADLRQAGHIPIAIGIMFVLADVRMALGRLNAVESIYRQALQLAEHSGETLPVGTADLYRGLAELSLERGELEAAAQQLLTAQHLGEQAALTGWPHRLRVTQARLKEAQGDLDGALDLLDEAERLYIRGPLPDVRPIAALKARLWIRQGKLAQAEVWARERGLDVDDELSYRREFEHVTLARALVARYRRARAEGAIRGAQSLLARLLAAAKAGGRVSSAIEALALQALAYEAQGKTPQALAALECALALAEPQGYARIFMGQAKPMAALLRKAAHQGIAAGYVRHLLAAFGEFEGESAGPQPLIEPLTGRELDVLALLTTDLSGPDIARELVVSLNTLRTHTKNIYSKLGVHNRRSAVRRAEELDLL